MQRGSVGRGDSSATFGAAEDDVLPGHAELMEHLAALTRLAAVVGGVDLGGVDASTASEAADALRAVSDRLGVVRARLLARIEADGRWAASGSARSFPDWVARRGGASVAAARRDATLGRVLDQDAPTAARAVGAGEMSLEHARVLSRYASSSEARRATLASDRTDRNEAFLVEAAKSMSVDDYGRLLRRWAAAVDTRAHEAEHASAVEREYLRLTPRPGGVDLQGFLAAENAEVVRTALRAVAGVPAADDARTPERRRAAALTGLARIVLDRGLGGAGESLVRPHLLVHVPFETFAALAADDAGTASDRVPVLENADGSLGAPAELDDGTPLPLSTLARLACDAQITRIVMDPAGQPLDVGRAKRTYTGAQRAAVIARDRTCRYPGCGAPPVLCEVHHIRWWTRGGDTSVVNGVLLCAYHHHLVHRRDITITRDAGQLRFTRGGKPIAATSERAVGPPRHDPGPDRGSQPGRDLGPDRGSQPGPTPPRPATAASTASTGGDAARAQQGALQLEQDVPGQRGVPPLEQCA